MTPQQIYENLIKRISEYHPSKDFSVIEKAYLFAYEAHGSQVRKSGEPYIIHPLFVAYTLADLELDRESIVSGLLHDTIEDTRHSYEDIVENFGREVADIVEGVTKLDKIEDELKEKSREKKPKKTSNEDKRKELQAENYRKMFLAMAQDIRIILIKIADRLHNMRTLEYVSPEKQKEKAQETLDIYCPLVHRLGISKWRYDLEDLSFRFLHPESYFDIKQRLERKQEDRHGFINRVVQEIKEKLEANDIKAFVEGRPKHFFSIYKKMKRQEKTLDEILDLFAVRVIVSEKWLCYDVMGIIHELYAPMEGHIKDMIAMPRPNKYQSLHTMIMGPEGEPVEIQIRTWEMHRTAEFGIAAHWKYKEGPAAHNKHNPEDEMAEKKLAWLNEILNWQRDMSDNKEFLQALKDDLDIYRDQIYCFTPTGEVIRLLRGSTPVDFAYAIHSALGNRMVGARVNGSIVKLDHQLNQGEQVEILASQNSRGPGRDWLEYAKTNQAKNKINQWFRAQNKEENIQRGKELLDKGAQKKKIPLSELLTSSAKQKVIDRYNFADWDALCAAVGHGGLKEGQVINKLIIEYDNERGRDIVIPPVLQIVDDITARERKTKSGIVVKGVGDSSVRFSRCCSPMPGDEVVGYVTRGRGLSVHRTDCKNVIHFEEVERNRLIEVEWQLPEKNAQGFSYRAEIQIIADDRMNLLMDISKVLAYEKVPVKALNARTSNGRSVFELCMEVSGREQFDLIEKSILALPGIISIERATV